MKLKLKMLMMFLVRIEKFFILVSILLPQKYFDDSNALVVGKMKDEMGGVAIEEFFGGKSIIYLILVSDSSEYEKAKDVN